MSVQLSSNRIIAYSYLAILNDRDRSGDIIDLFCGFMKNVFNKMYDKSVKSGQITDIKNSLFEHYSLDAPFPVLKNIVDKLCAEIHKQADRDLHFNTDYSFQMTALPFPMQIVKEEEIASDLELVNSKYTAYASSRCITEPPSLFDFFDKNRLALCSYFTQPHENGGISLDGYEICAEFIEDSRNDKDVYQILRHLFTGSIISCYLELAPTKFKSTKTTFTVDTTFLLSFLGLQSEISLHTAKAIVHWCRELGHSFEILDITIDEVYNLINRFAKTYKPGLLPTICDPESLDAACYRKNLKQTALIQMASNLRRRLKSEKMNVVKLSDEFKKEAERSDLFKKIQCRKHNPEGAPHDGYAAYYVQKKRGYAPMNFADAKYWFLTDTKHSSSSCITPDGTMFEQIRADYLISIIWFSSPNLKTNEIAQIGLDKLARHALHESSPDIQLLRDLEENITRFSNDNVTTEDLVLLANTNACKSIENLKTLNELAKESPDKFRETLFEILKESKAKIEAQEQETSQKLSSLEAENDDLKSENDKIREDKRSRINQEVERLRSSIADFEQIVQGVRNKAKKATRRKIVACVSILIVLQVVIVFLCFKLGWDKMEIWTYVWNLVPTLLVYVYFLLYEKIPNPTEIGKRLKDNAFERYSEEIRINPQRITDMKKELQGLEKILETIQTG